MACKTGNGVCAALLLIRGANADILNKQTEKPFAAAIGESMQVYKVWMDGGTKGLAKRYSLAKSLAGNLISLVRFTSVNTFSSHVQNRPIQARTEANKKFIQEKGMPPSCVFLCYQKSSKRPTEPVVSFSSESPTSSPKIEACILSSID